MKKIKDENKILIMLAFFSISIGLWENFKQLWLQSNSFNISQIGTILSIASMVSAVCIFIISTRIELKNIKNLYQ